MATIQESVLSFATRVILQSEVTCGQRSWNQVLTRGMSTERRVRPERLQNGCGAHSSPMPCAVLSVYSGVASKKGLTPA